MSADVQLGRRKQSARRLLVVMVVWAMLLGLLAVADYRPEWLPWTGGSFALVMLVSVYSILAVSSLFIAHRLDTKLVSDPSAEAGLADHARIFLDATTNLLGFENNGPSMAARPGQSCVLRAHATDPFWACVVLRDQSVLGLDIFTEFEGQRVLVTSSSKSSALILPRRYRAQCLPAMSPKELVDAHREAVHQLAARGWRTDPVNRDELPAALVRHYDRLLDAFVRKPLRNTIAILWRGVSMRDPYSRPLSEQKNALAGA